MACHSLFSVPVKLLFAQKWKLGVVLPWSALAPGGAGTQRRVAASSVLPRVLLYPRSQQRVGLLGPPWGVRGWGGCVRAALVLCAELVPARRSGGLGAAIQAVLHTWGRSGPRASDQTRECLPDRVAQGLSRHAMC